MLSAVAFFIVVSLLFNWGIALVILLGFALIRSVATPTENSGDHDLQEAIKSLKELTQKRKK